MGKSCLIKTCVGPWNSPSDSFHRIPSCGVGQDMWIQFVKKANIEQQQIQFKKNMYVCSRHFQNCCFNETNLGRKKLCSGHYPSISNTTIIKTTILSKCFNDATSKEDEIESTADDDNNESLDKIHDLNLDLKKAEETIHRLEQEIKTLREKYEDAMKEIKAFKRSSKRNEISQKRKSDAISELGLEVIKLKKAKISHELISVNSPSTENENTKREYGLKKIFLELFNRKKVEGTTSYSEFLREFAFHIHYLSPRTYEFLRDALECTLPHPRGFSRWTRNVSTAPGFIPISLDFIKKRCNEYSHRMYYSLAFDEMYIRKQIIYDGNVMKGFINYGNLASEISQDKEAKTALFFLANEINGNKKIPIGYILTDGLDADLMSAIVSKCLIVMHEMDAKVLNVTFDGLPTNFAAMEKLGANLSVTSDNFAPFIQHPTTGDKVFIIPDPVHMLKLFRNALKAYGVFINSDGEEIKWEYLDALLKIQNETGLRAANRLTKRHVNFEQQKMNVSLCTQTVSSSVAIALDVCRILNIKGFKKSEATSNLIKLMDRLFDALNSLPKGKGLKAPLNSANARFWRPLFKEARHVLLNLKRKGSKRFPHVSLLNTKRSTFVRGLLICIASVELIMDEVILEESHDLMYLPVYKLSQDPLEHFFGNIRSRFGNNDNPNAIQLEHALKALLCMNLKVSLSGNCITREEIATKISPLGNLFSLRNPDNNSILEISEELPDLPPMKSLSAFIKNVVVYISGFVMKKLCGTINCAYCLASLFPSESDSSQKIPQKQKSDFVLIRARNNGGLHLPSDDLIKVCKITELSIRSHQGQGLKQFNRRKLVNYTVQKCNKPDIFKKLRTTNNQEHPLFSNHVLNLITAIVEHFLKVRLHHIAKEATIGISPETNRNSCNKSVHFAGN